MLFKDVKIGQLFQDPQTPYLVYMKIMPIEYMDSVIINAREAGQTSMFEDDYDGLVDQVSCHLTFKV